MRCTVLCEISCSEGWETVRLCYDVEVSYEADSRGSVMYRVLGTLHSRDEDPWDCGVCRGACWLSLAAQLPTSDVLQYLAFIMLDSLIYFIGQFPRTICDRSNVGESVGVGKGNKSFVHRNTFADLRSLCCWANTVRRSGQNLLVFHPGGVVQSESHPFVKYTFFSVVFVAL